MSPATLDPTFVDALEQAVSILRDMAEFKMDDETVRRMRELGENKERCSDDDRAEHRALAKLWRKGTLQKLQAINVLRQLQATAPELVGDLSEFDVDL